MTKNPIEFAREVRAEVDRMPRVEPAIAPSWHRRYTLGPGDTLNLSMYDRPDLSRTSVPIAPDGTISYADETLSARSYRAYRDGKIFGKLTMKPINLLFFWQGPDHCYKAYLKERARKNLPAEYQDDPVSPVA